MSQTRLPLSQTTLIAAASSLFVLLSGCQALSSPPDPASKQNTAAHAETSVDADSPQKTYSEQSKQQTEEIPDIREADISNDANAAAPDAGQSRQSKGVVETASEKAKWNANVPKLLTLSIGQSDKDVYESFGEELDSYILEEDDDSVKVLEYNGFAVGINSRQEVQYVEVYDAQIAPGLGGLKIGNKADAAVKLLGKPDKQTTFLLMYKAKGALLKLDLDPDNKKIISIKLLKA